jgi:hypothetical protein
MTSALLGLLPELADLLFFGLGSVLPTGVGTYFGPYLMGYGEFRARPATLRRDMA